MHVQRSVDEVIVVTDEEITAAVRLLVEQCKLVAEPAGAAGVAALLGQKVGSCPGSAGNWFSGRLLVAVTLMASTWPPDLLC
jgi:threonine dehydratase